MNTTPTAGCNKACYECLLNYYNQRDHEKLDRNLILPTLRLLESAKTSHSPASQSKAETGRTAESM